jgi:hypothetical protein
VNFRPRSIEALDAFVQRHGAGSIVEEGETLFLDRDAQGQRIPLGMWETGRWWDMLKPYLPVSWYVDEMVHSGRWREEVVPASVVGLPRAMRVVRAARKGNFIVGKWHGDGETFCPAMWDDLAIGSGSCGMCRACFLILTHRARRDPRRHLLYDNVERFWKEAGLWLQGKGRYAYTRKASRHRTLGLGIDRSDSLLFEGVTGHARTLVPMFADGTTNPDGRRLVLLTKTANVHFLEGLPTDNVIVSMSLNGQAVADVWENEWPDGRRVTRRIAERVWALVEAQNMGFEIRIRLDPLLPIVGWRDIYSDFVASAAAAGLQPRMVTLGSYRQKNAQLLAWARRWGLPALEWEPADLVSDGTHEHLSLDSRVTLYQALLMLCREAWPDVEVGLCKETHQVRRALGLMRARCNCLAV